MCKCDELYMSYKLISDNKNIWQSWFMTTYEIEKIILHVACIWAMHLVIFIYIMSVADFI